MSTATLKRNTEPVRMRNYGRIVQDMVALAAKEQDPNRRHQMVIYIAQCMRQKNAIWNKEQESGIQRLKEDIYTLSKGVLTCDFPEFEPLMQQLMQRPLSVANDTRSNIMPMKKKKKVM